MVCTSCFFSFFISILKLIRERESMSEDSDVQAPGGFGCTETCPAGVRAQIGAHAGAFSWAAGGRGRTPRGVLVPDARTLGADVRCTNSVSLRLVRVQI